MRPLSFRGVLVELTTAAILLLMQPWLLHDAGSVRQAPEGRCGRTRRLLHGAHCCKIANSRPAQRCGPSQTGESDCAGAKSDSACALDNNARRVLIIYSVELATRPQPDGIVCQKNGV